MPRWFSILFQAVATVTQGVNMWGGFFPPKAQGWVALGVGAAQAAVGSIAHSFNPDGTPATTAYVPPIK